MGGVRSLKFLYEKQTRRFYLFLVVICLLQIFVLGICGIFQAQDIRRILIKRELAAASYLLEQEVSPHRKLHLLTCHLLLLLLQNRFENHLPAGETGAIFQLFGSIEQLAMSLQAKSEMEHKAKMFLRDMISNISHQLKTPLAALNMYMEIIKEEPENEETVEIFSRKSMKSLERMEQLIQSLLKMARLDTGNIVFEKRECFAAEVAGQAVNDLLERAKQEGKEILIDGRPEERLICDQEWTKEAVGNLIKNALDHTETGDVIRVSWKRTPAVFRMTVEDNGSGIAQEDIHHIFKQFYRSRSSSDRQGTGLGLSLAKSIVEGQGGESVCGEQTRRGECILADLSYESVSFHSPECKVKMLFFFCTSKKNS